MTTTDGSRSISTCIAELRAWIMFIFAMRSGLLFGELRSLAAQMLRHVVIDVVEHGERIRARSFVQRAVRARFLPGLRDVLLALRDERPLLLLAPFAQRDEMILQPIDGIAQRPRGFLIFRP